MKKQFLGREKNGTIGGCVKEREKSSEDISRSCQRRQLLPGRGRKKKEDTGERKDIDRWCEVTAERGYRGRRYCTVQRPPS